MLIKKKYLSEIHPHSILISIQSEFCETDEGFLFCEQMKEKIIKLLITLRFNNYTDISCYCFFFTFSIHIIMLKMLKYSGEKINSIDIH